MESMTLQSEKFKEKLTREKEKSVFEEQLREIDTEIFGKADMGGNVQMVSKVRILESEKMVSANREEKVASEEPVHGLGVGLLSSGPQDVMGLSKDLDGPAGKNTSLDQVIGKQCFQSGPKMPIANEGVLTRKAKSPNRKKASHTCMQVRKRKCGEVHVQFAEGKRLDGDNSNGYREGRGGAKT